MTDDPTPLLFHQLAKVNNVSKAYRRGYVDALLDVHNLLGFASEVNVEFSD